MKRVITMLTLVILTITVVLTGCGGSQSATTPEKQEATPAPEGTADETPEETAVEDEPKAVEYKQSPMLDGKGLPPVAERLPKEPKIVNEMPPEQLSYEIGKYGGKIRTVTTDIEWDADIFGMCNEPLINTPGMLGKEITGNILKGYEVSTDQKEFTFFMREGLKWSDGTPVTVEDIEFTVKDVIFNEELTPIFPAWLRSGGRGDGKPFDFEVVDQYTFKMKFDEPYGGLLLRLAIQGWRSYTDLLKPKHFLKKFHKSYASEEELESLIEEEGLEAGDWVSLFNVKDITNWELNQNKAIGFPVLNPWMIVERRESTGVYERNPYFYKIDSEGNQLPYVDYLESYLVQDAEMASVKIVGGEVDFCRAMAVLIKAPFYKENAEKGGYNVDLVDDHGTQNDIFLNLTHEDPIWRQVVRDVRFRKALNYAVNREEIKDTVYYGFSEFSPMNENKFDLDEANRLLDEMGMTKGADGYRVGPDGKRFTIPFEIGAHITSQVAVAELIVEMWKELDLHVTLNTIDAALWGTRNDANELKATIIWTHSPLWWYGDMGQGFWAPLWIRWWNTGGAEGEEPPEEVKTFYKLMDKISVGSPEEGINTYEQIKKEMQNNVWYILPAGEIKVPLITNAKLGNTPEKGFAMAINFSAETFFYKE